MHFGLSGHQLGKDATKPERVLAKRRTHPVVAGGCRVAFVEDQVHDLEHRRQPRAQLRSPRHFIGHAGFGECLLGPYDSLRDGGLGRQKCARDFFRGETAKKPKRQRDARLSGEHGMARCEHQSQQVVADIIVKSGVEIGHSVLLLQQLVAEFLVFPIEQAVTAEVVDCPVFCGGRQPGAGVPRHALGGPLLERGDQRVVRQVFGDADVADHARQAGDDLRGFDTPDRFNGSMDVGCGHRHPSNHLPQLGCNSRTGRTSMLPTRAGGILEASAIASSQSLASIR